jgi:hypothetical protein
VTLQTGKNQPGRTSEHTPRQPPDPVSYWLIAEKRNNELEVLTIRTDDEQETLPVFSSEEEAEIILRFGGVTGGWRARESGAGELVSVLSGPCAGVKKVALDPSPEMVVEGTVGLVSLLRGSFIGQIMVRRSGPSGLGGSEERSSTDRSFEAIVCTRTGGMSIEPRTNISEKWRTQQMKEKGDVGR